MAVSLPDPVPATPVSTRPFGLENSSRAKKMERTPTNKKKPQGIGIEQKSDKVGERKRQKIKHKKARRLEGKY